MYYLTKSEFLEDYDHTQILLSIRGIKESKNLIKLAYKLNEKETTKVNYKVFKAPNIEECFRILWQYNHYIKSKGLNPHEN